MWSRPGLGVPGQGWGGGPRALLRPRPRCVPPPCAPRATGCCRPAVPGGSPPAPAAPRAASAPLGMFQPRNSRGSNSTPRPAHVPAARLPAPPGTALGTAVVTWGPVPGLGRVPELGAGTAASLGGPSPLFPAPSSGCSRSLLRIHRVGGAWSLKRSPQIAGAQQGLGAAGPWSTGRAGAFPEREGGRQGGCCVGAGPGTPSLSRQRCLGRAPVAPRPAPGGRPERGSARADVAGALPRPRSPPGGKLSVFPAHSHLRWARRGGETWPWGGSRPALPRVSPPRSHRCPSLRSSLP